MKEGVNPSRGFCWVERIWIHFPSLRSESESHLSPSPGDFKRRFRIRQNRPSPNTLHYFIASEIGLSLLDFTDRRRVQFQVKYSTQQRPLLRIKPFTGDATPSGLVVSGNFKVNNRTPLPPKKSSQKLPSRMLCWDDFWFLT